MRRVFGVDVRLLSAWLLTATAVAVVMAALLGLL